MKKDGERYDKVFEQMELLGIKDVSTPRQCKNSTVVWRLPIKINYPGNAERFIEVASFKTGYVRNQNCGYSNYQLNKRCDGEPEYFQLDNGDFRKFTTRSCILIPNEIDRLEYLIAYCLKNYYIKNANQVANGGYVEQWYHENILDKQSNTANHQFELNALQNKLANSVPKWKYDELESRVDVVNDKLVNSKDYTADLKARLTKVTRECNHAYDCGLSDGEKKANETYSENTGAMVRIDDLEDKIIDLKAQLHMAQEKLAATLP